MVVADELTVLAARALEGVADGTRIGLGTGHTVDAFLEALARRVSDGLRIRGVPSSEATARRARDLGIPLDTLVPAEPLEMTIDGADEVEQGTLNLIKGWGGALVRERIVAAASRRQVILVTGEKLVDRLGARGKLPVEVLPFAAPFCRRRIEQLSGFGRLLPALRGDTSQPFTSDNGNWIVDCEIERQHDPAGLERALRCIPGVVDTGLFLGTASVVLVAEAGNVRELRRPNG
jgi:ribose 5-phosphate isomerase A